MTRWALVVCFATFVSLNSAGFQEDSDTDGRADDNDYAVEATDENDVTGPFLNATATKTDGNVLLARRTGPPKQIKRKIWKDIRREVRDMKNNILPVLAGNISYMELDVRDMNRNFFSMVGDVRFMKNEIEHIKQQAHVIWENVTDTRRDHKRMNKTLWSILNNVTLIFDYVDNALRQLTEMRDSYSRVDERLDGAVGKLFELSSVPKLIDDMSKKLTDVVDLNNGTVTTNAREVHSIRDIIGHVAQSMTDMKEKIMAEFTQVSEDMDTGENRILSNVSDVKTKIALQENSISFIADNVMKIIQGVFEVSTKVVDVWDMMEHVGKHMDEIGSTIIGVDKRLDEFEDEMEIIGSKVDNTQHKIGNLTDQFTTINIGLETVNNRIVSSFGSVKNDLNQMKGQFGEVKRVIRENCKVDFDENGDDGEVLPDRESPEWYDRPEVSAGWDPIRPNYPTGGGQYPTFPQPPSYPENGYPTSTPRFRPTSVWLPPTSWQPPTVPRPTLPWQPPTSFPAMSPAWQPSTEHPPWPPWQPNTEYQPWPPWQPSTEHPPWPPWQPSTEHPPWPSWQPSTEHPPWPPWQPPRPTSMPPAYPPSTIFPTTPGHPQIPIHPEHQPPSHVPPIGGLEGPPAPAGPDQHMPGVRPSTGRPMWAPSPPLQDDGRWPTQLPLGPRGPGLPIGCGHQFTGHCACVCPCDCICPTVEPGISTFTTSRYDRFMTTRPSGNPRDSHKKCYCLCKCPCRASTTIRPPGTEGPVAPPFQPPGMAPGHGLPHERPWPGHSSGTLPAPAPPGWPSQPGETVFLNTLNELLRGMVLVRQDLKRVTNLVESKHQLLTRTIVNELNSGFEQIMREIRSLFDINVNLSKEGITLTLALQMQLNQAMAKAVYSLEAIAINILEFHEEFSSLSTISPPVSDRRPSSHPITVRPFTNESELQPPDFTPPGQAPSYVPSNPIDRPDGRPQLILPGHSPNGSPHAEFPAHSVGQPTLRPLTQLVGERPPRELIGRPPPQKPQSWYPAQYPGGPNFQYFGLPSGPGPELSYRSIPRERGNSQWITDKKLTNNVTAVTTEVSLSSGVARRMLPNDDEGKEKTNNARKSAGKKRKKIRRGCVVRKKYINAKPHSPRLIGDQDLVFPDIKDETDERDYDESIQEVDERDFDVMPRRLIEMPSTEIMLPEEDMGMIGTPVDPFAFHNLLQEHINDQLMNAIQPDSFYRVKEKRLPSGRWHGRTRNRYKKKKSRPMFPIMPGFPFIQSPIRLRPPIPPEVFPKPITIRPPRIPNIFGRLPHGMMVAGINGSPYSASFNDGRGNSWNVNVNRRNYLDTKAKLNREHRREDKEEHKEDEEEKFAEEEHEHDYEEREK